MEKEESEIRQLNPNGMETRLLRIKKNLMDAQAELMEFGRIFDEKRKVWVKLKRDYRKCLRKVKK